MKFSPDTHTSATTNAPALAQISFPSGIVGFPEFTSAELVCEEQEKPFMWLCGTANEKTSFIVIEPTGVIQGYQIELSEGDVAALDLKNPNEARILNIATLQQGNPTRITINLIGPIVINTRTGIARQVVISNNQNYSARHVLYELQGK